MDSAEIVGLPAEPDRLAVVSALEHVVQGFEPGRHFPEREVDAVLPTWTGGAREGGV